MAEDDQKITRSDAVIQGSALVNDVIEATPNALDTTGKFAAAIGDKANDPSMMGRRGFLGSLFAIGVAACTKPKETPIPAATDHYVNLGTNAVYYGLKKDTSPADLENLRKYETVIVQPETDNPGQANDDYLNKELISAGNAMAYTSLTSLIQGSTTTSKLWKDIEAIDGWLKDSNGAYVLDPTYGNIPVPRMVDLRIPAVHDLMLKFLLDRAREYPKGIYVDSMDANTELENYNYEFTDNPITGVISNVYRVNETTIDTKGKNSRGQITDKKFDGLTQAAAQLFYDVNYKAGGNKVCVGGGLNDPLAYFNSSTEREPVLTTIAKNGCKMSLESQLYARGGGPGLQEKRTAKDNAWTKRRLTDLAKSARNAGRGNIDILMLEPVNSLTPTAVNYESMVREAGYFYGPIVKQISEDTGVRLTTSLYIGDVFDNTNAPKPDAKGLFDFASTDAIKQNIAFQGKESDYNLVMNDKRGHLKMNGRINESGPSASIA